MLHHCFHKSGSPFQRVDLKAVYRGIHSLLDQFVGKAGFFERLLTTQAGECECLRRIRSKKSIAFWHIRLMPVQRQFPLLRIEYMPRAENLDADKLLEGGLQRLHEPRKILRRIQNADVIGRQFSGIDDDQILLLECDSEETVQVLRRNSVEFHVPAGVENPKKPLFID